MAQELVPLVSDFQTAGMAFEELDAQVSLKKFHRLCHGRLGNRQRMRGPAYGPVFRNGDKIL